MVSIEDFITKTSKEKGNYKNLYLDKIKKGDKRTLRILENVESNNVKKFIFMHSYLSGIGSTPCTNTAENVKAGDICPFCQNAVDELNKVAKEHFEWLKTLDIVNKEETDKFNNEISKMADKSKPKLIFKNGKVFELENTFDSEIFYQLTDEQKKIYKSFYDKNSFAEGKARSCKFYIPVFDYATDEIKIWEFSPSIWNKLDENFTKAGYAFNSADFSITHNGIKGNWWLVSKKDSSPISNEIVQKYENVKETIYQELNRKINIPTHEKQIENFNKYKEALLKKQNDKENSNKVKEEINSSESFSNQTNVDKELEQLFS